MKQLSRLPEPESFFKNEKKIKFYKDLKNNNGEIKDRWNLPKYKTDLKNRLLEISDYECSYCGNKINFSNSEVEHYLPQAYFPYLAYCYDNYLAVCNECNRVRKNKFAPKSLLHTNKNFGEELLKGELDGIIPYNKEEVLSGTSDRIIEPTFDLIEEHLEFEPASCCYSAKTNIGELTNKMFFQYEEVISVLQKYSSLIYSLIKNGNSEELILELGNIFGYSFYFKELYAFWNMSKNPM